MSEVIKIRKGLDIKLKGKAEKIFIRPDPAEFYAVKPTDFHNIIPRLTVKTDSYVKAGTSLFYDKSHPEIFFTSPVSGNVVAINRGERRQILEVVIKADAEIEYETFDMNEPARMNVKEIKDILLKSGLWPAIRQRPYDIIANPDDMPKAIFISAFDTAPLAPDYDFIVKGQEIDFQKGIDALSKLTVGKVHININDEYPASQVFTNAMGVRINRFRGPHPAGNVGIQIHYVDPINKGDLIWYVSPQDVIIIGRLFNEGIYDASKVVALAGSEVLKPRYYKVLGGTSIKNIVENNITDGNNRFISGNVLTGIKIAADSFVGYYDSQVTVIPEGDHYELLGWAMPGFRKYSVSRSYWSWLYSDREYKLDTNLNGGLRAFVMTGQYEKVFPMDIFPVQLLKAILIKDIDLMEKLGIYEVAPEDFALCEFVCTSKIDIQHIVREGLDFMIKEM
jgi:Na+-transporting NADH:ubiquinone oxidoreductase subunit A